MYSSRCYHDSLASVPRRLSLPRQPAVFIGDDVSEETHTLVRRRPGKDPISPQATRSVCHRLHPPVQDDVVVSFAATIYSTPYVDHVA